MNNIVLSPQVKDYFVNALKGIGIRRFDQNQNQFVEMTENEISAFLDDTSVTPLDIFESIKLATEHQLQNDTQGDRRLERCTAVKQETVTKALASNEYKQQGLPDLEEANARNFVKEVSNFNNNSYQTILAQTIIENLKVGIGEQKTLTGDSREASVKLQKEALAFWDKISDSECEAYNAMVPPQNQFNKKEYSSYLLESDLIEKTKQMFSGDETQAQKFLETKFNKEAHSYLKVSNSVLKIAEDICQGRGEKDLTMQDVMLATMRDSTVEQTITYFQTRSQEQKVSQQTGDKSVTKENKIGNLMGKDGRKLVERAAIYFDNDKKKTKSGKKTWRGYKKLFDKVYNNLVQGCLLKGIVGFTTISFTDRMLAKNAPKKRIINDKNLTHEKPWEVKMEEIPEQFKNQQNQGQAGNGKSPAESFYEKAKARLMADKMRNANIQLMMNDSMITGEKLSELKAQLGYLNYRIATAENVISDISRLSKDDVLLQDSNYFQQLEAQILNEKTLAQYKKIDVEIKQDDENQKQTPKPQRKSKNKKKQAKKQKQKDTQVEQKQPEQQKESAEYLAVESLINAGRDHTANEEMNVAFQEFESLSKGVQTSARKSARCSMAREMFGLSTREVPDDAQVAEIANRFEQNKLSKLKAQLTNSSALKGQIAQNDIEQTFKEINSFVQDDLKTNVFSQEYETYLVGEKTEEVLAAAANNICR